MTFQYETCAALINGLPITLEAAKQFAHNARYDHDTVKSLSNVIADLRAELTLREGEIAMLKESLLSYETPLKDKQ